MNQKPRVSLYGKAGCKKCLSAKEKLDLFASNGTIDGYGYYDLEAFDEDWRTTGTVDAMAYYQWSETLPVIIIDSEVLSYSQAMRKLKGLKSEGKKHAEEKTIEERRPTNQHGEQGSEPAEGIISAKRETNTCGKATRASEGRENTQALSGVD
jgi:hypothetical protein